MFLFSYKGPPAGSEALHSLCTLCIRRTATAADAENTTSIMHETVSLIQRETQSRLTEFHVFASKIS